ncbi:MAG: flagellar hook-length control protein FliK [Candidatus Hinthialibacter antarcticus]|nr:flagellar hook-length control protein FliK [Candidatus Hinthialibacter antarcticus]
MEQLAAPQLLPIQTGLISESTPKPSSDSKDGGVSFHDLFSESLKATSAKRNTKDDSDSQPVLAIGDLKIPLESLKKDKDGHFILSLEDLKELLSEAQKQGLIDAKQAKAIEKGETSLASLLIQGSENGDLFTLSVQNGKGVLTPAPNQTNNTNASLHALQIQSALEKAETETATKTKIQTDHTTTSKQQPLAAEGKALLTGNEKTDALLTSSEKNVEAAVTRLSKRENESIESLKTRLNQTDSALLMRKEGEIQSGREALDSKIEQSRLSRTPADIKKELFQGELKNQRNAPSEITGKQSQSTVDAKTKTNAETIAKPVINAEVKLASNDNTHYDLRDTSKGVLNDAALRILLDKSEPKQETKLEPKASQVLKDAQVVKVDAQAKQHSDASNGQAQQDKSSKKENGSFKQAAKAELDKGALQAMSDKPTAAPKASSASQAESNARVEQSNMTQTAAQSRPVETQAPVKSASPTTSAFQDRVDKVQQAANQQIVRGVKGAISAERSDVTIRLTPQSLGRVSVQLVMDHGHLTANLSAQKEATQAMLEKNIHLLKSALDDNNIKVERINIIREPGDARQQSDQQRERSQEERSAQQKGSQDNPQSGSKRNPNGQRWNWNEYWNTWNNWRQTT